MIASHRFFCPKKLILGDSLNRTDSTEHTIILTNSLYIYQDMSHTCNPTSNYTQQGLKNTSQTSLKTGSMETPNRRTSNLFGTILYEGNTVNTPNNILTG